MAVVSSSMCVIKFHITRPVKIWEISANILEKVQNRDIHRESKKQDTKLLAITSLTIIRFSKFFTSRLGSKFATNSCLNIPPRFKHVAKLPCAI